MDPQPELLGRELARDHADLRLLVLLGSRATGTAHARSDWDLGFLAGPGLDLGTLQSHLTAALASDAVDLVDLATASAVLRRDAASVGRPVLQREGGEFEAFQIEAATFWCDAGPVLRQAHADVLRALAG